MDPITLILIILATVILVIAAVVLYRASRFSIEMGDPEPIDLPEVDAEDIARHIGLAVQLKTISHTDPAKIEPLPFEGLRNLLSTLYPQVEYQLNREVINDHALLYTWMGSDPTLDPVAFTAHQDVVPANEASDSGWTYPPFSGTVADGYVWGRGTLDCKGVLIGIMEAVNNLLKEGFVPKRTVYLAFGHDEENSGTYGAASIARLLQERGVRLSFLMDEGGAITSGTVPGVSRPAAMIGVAEKGHLTLKLRARTAPGHAATPPKNTAIGALSLAIATLESNPFPQDLEMVEFMMSFLGGELPFSTRMALANPWLFGGLLRRKFAETPATNAVTRTTLSPTIIQGGTAENVLPAEASAILNIRIQPGDSVVEVFETVRDMVDDDIIEVLPAHGDTLLGEHTWEPTGISEVDSPQFLVLANLVKAAFPGTMVAPYLMSGATDARHYAPICDHAFRFSPFLLTDADQASVHGINERLSIENAGHVVAFMQEAIMRLSSLAENIDLEELVAETQNRNLPGYDEEELAVRRMRQPLPTRVYQPPAADEADFEALDEPELLKTRAEETENYLDDFPYDDEPLVTRPIKKDG